MPVQQVITNMTARLERWALGSKRRVLREECKSL
jgi:hypothetical protein